MPRSAAYQCESNRHPFGVLLIRGVNSIKNPVALRMEGYSEDSSVNPALAKILAQMLRKLAEEGETRQGFIRLYPIKSVRQQGDCFVISFSRRSQLPCENLGRIR